MIRQLNGDILFTHTHEVFPLIEKCLGSLNIPLYDSGCEKGMQASA
jgi:hypothetical protein